MLPRRFPNLAQWSVDAVDRVVIGHRESGDFVIGFGPLARHAAKQIPVAAIRVPSDNGKIRASTDLLMSDAGWNYNYVAGMQLYISAVLATELQSRVAAVDAQRFMRGAVIMGKRIDAVSPRIRPIVATQAFFHDRSTVSVFRCECLSIHEQRQHAIWKNAVVGKSELLRLNEFSRDHRVGFSIQRIIAPVEGDGCISVIFT